MSGLFTEIGAEARAPKGLVPFRFREVGGDILLTNFLGDWVFLTKAEFGELARGQLAQGSSLYEKLSSRSFVRETLDEAKAAERIAYKKRFLSYGPNLHIAVVTLRCNETCVYCHASRANMDAVHTDMTPEIGEKVVDLMLQSTSPAVTLEFQGGEPLVNFPVMKHIIEYALARNRAYGKELEFTMVSNLAMMDEEKLAFLVDRKVQICTSIDGPEHIHTKQRILAGGNSHREAIKWIERINKAYIDLGLDPTLYHVEALLTTTREALKYPKEIVDTYVGLGCRAIFLRPVDPFGFAGKTAQIVEYDRAAFLDFYRAAVEHILDLNRRGEQVLERYAAIFLTKILGDEEPNFLDIRSPSGSGIGAIAYNYDGKIFSSDEGRMMYESGDGFFQIGDVFTSTYRSLMKHETVRALVMASIRETQPDCVNCTYTPYCGIQPEHNYRTQGTIFGRMRESTLCAVHKGIQDYLFDKLRTNDPKTVEILRRWTTVRARSHFIHASTAS
ncbi:His-Xaa-Ser system radical SAM maturase HxsB [Polyangium aurulentum]|uniref:His-Xaa-Ser system radical SAM maturase HxsB n=1 Tax=Polyangium aurulentum TaxID=2567896 RepID=UPI0010ADE326|nr:His-Xaa-Ser system radical SAM maturase HxsB [Polyangium aurulentum]UQA61571.1 His-Xaa-Ser system radical SAM maturase HxsB [Polyangium aurulentum]